MNTRPAYKLATLPYIHMPVGMTLATVAWVGTLLLIPFIGAIAIAFIAITTWLACMAAGMTLHTLMRTESLMLPDFRRHLVMAGLLYALVLIGIPSLLAWTSHESVNVIVLLASTQFLTTCAGLATGTGNRVLRLLWVVFLLPNFLPKRILHLLLDVLLHSPWVPALAILLGALCLIITLRPLARIEDPEDDESPLQAIADGRRQSNSTGGRPMRRGFIGRRLTPFLDATARRNLAHALERIQRHPGTASRMAAIRAVLLPHDNVQGAAINILVTSVFGLLYILLIRHDQHWSSGYIAAYAVVIGLSRFAAAGSGMVKMRPNLADLYLTLGPNSHSEFQATLADALLKLVVISVLNSLVFTALLVIVLRSQLPGEVMLAALITSVGGAFSALAFHLIGPESKTGRAAAQMLLMLGVGLSFVLVLWLMHHFGVLIGGFAGIVICIPFGLGAWQYARREYMSRRPVFDAPME